MILVATTAALNLVKSLCDSGIRDEAVLQEVANTPRELFIDATLWHKAY